jgi:hypothetical protein
VKFKIKKILNDRQMRKAKWSVSAAVLYCAFTLA